MDCASCGHGNRESAAFCDRCGARLAARCGACSTELRAGARFCDHCGQPQAAPVRDPLALTPPRRAQRILRDRASIEGERRSVTVLFIDAVSSTSAGERLDPEALHHIVHASTERMIDSVNRYEGTVTQFRGDGIMAIFGAPIAQEDAARRAISAALLMREALDAYAREPGAAGTRALSYRIGLHSGPVVVGRIGDDLTMDYTAVGDTVNLAARMEQWAAPGAIYVTDATQRQAAGYFEFRDLGQLEVKGKAETVHVFEVVRELPARTRLDASAERGLSTYQGREEELAMLLRSYDAVRAGTGQVVFVSGEAGIGKSRLLLEFRREIGSQARWLEGHCISYGRGMPYVPIVDLVKRAFGVDESDLDMQVSEKVEAATVSWHERSLATLPYLRFLLNLDPGDERIAAMDAVERRAGVLDGLRALVAEEASRGPVVILIEDLHWVDEKSQEAVAALVDAVASAPVLLVLTHRPGYQHPFGDRSYFERVALRHLAGDACRRLVADVLQSPELPPRLHELIVSRAEGNPFYVEELTKSLLETGTVRRRNGALELARPIEQISVPGTIQDVILTRIDRLQPPAREALQLASVIGREFTVRLLDRIGRAEAQLDQLLGELKQLELIYEKAYFPELSYMFKHALTHEVALSTLLAARRKALHRLVATAVEELYADRLADQYEMLAHHFYEGEAWEKALEYLAKAGDKAAAADANGDAVAFYGKAIEVATRLNHPPDTFLRGVVTGRFWANYNTGELAAAISDADRLIEMCHLASDREAEGEALLLRGDAQLWAHEFEESMASINQAQAIASEGYAGLETAAAVLLGQLHGVLVDVKRSWSAIAIPQEEVALLKDTDRANHAVMVGALLNWSGDFAEAARHFERSRRTFGESSPVFTRAMLELTEAFPLVGKGDYDRALASLERTIAMHERYDVPLAAARAYNTVGFIYGELQDFERAIEWNQRSVDAAIAMQSLDPEVEFNARLNLGDCHAALGRFDDAAGQYAIVEKVARNPTPAERFALLRYSQHLYHSAGELRLRLGDIDGALAYADDCLALAEEQDARKNITKGRRLRAQALVARGDLDGADREMTVALEHARATGNPPQLWKTLIALGHLRAAQGDRDAASAAYAEAVMLIERVATSLQQESMRRTFLDSAYVAEARARLSSVTPN